MYLSEARLTYAPAAAKSGGKKVVAVADEEGTISLMDGEANQWHAGRSPSLLERAELDEC